MITRFSLPIAFLLSGCITVVVPPGDADGSASARQALERGQRHTEQRQVERRQESLDAISNTAVRIASDTQAWAMKPAQFGGGLNRSTA